MALPPVNQMLGDIEELEKELRRRMCAQVREMVEKMKAKPTYPFLKPFIRSYLGDLLSECEVEL